MEDCNEGKAVLEGGLFFTNRGRRQNVILRCSRRKSATYPFSPTEIEEEAEGEEPSESMPRALQHRRRLPSVSSTSRVPPGVIAAPRASISSYPTKQMPDASGRSDSPVTLASLGLPPPGPVLCSLIGQDATHMDFDGFFSDSTAAPSTAAPNNVPNRKNDQLHSRPNREFFAQVNTSTTSKEIIDLTNGDDAPAVLPATVDSSNRSSHERSSQVNTPANWISAVNSGLSNAAVTGNTDGAYRMRTPRTGISVTGEQAARASRTVPASATAARATPTAEDLENAMPLSRYGPLGVPRKVEKKTGKQ